MDLESILKYLSQIFNVFKRDPGLIEETAEKRDIKNKVRAKRAEAKILRIEKKIDRRKRKAKRRETNN
jgi:Asp-tRNA(Asn)/Glu-tRNA(Gln) amidotransferase C subunit